MAVRLPEHVMETLFDAAAIRRPGHWYDGLVWLGGAAAAGLAAVAATVLAVVFAVTLAVVAVLTGAVIALGSLAWRAGRNRRNRRAGDPGVIEARHVGGHSWVACGWDQQGR
jgi:hypothetical protein